MATIRSSWPCLCPYLLRHFPLQLARVPLPPTAALFSTLNTRDYFHSHCIRCRLHSSTPLVWPLGAFKWQPWCKMANARNTEQKFRPLVKKEWWYTTEFTPTFIYLLIYLLDLLGWHWLIKLRKFQMHIICILHCTLTTQIRTDV